MINYELDMCYVGTLSAEDYEALGLIFDLFDRPCKVPLLLSFSGLRFENRAVSVFVVTRNLETREVTHAETFSIAIEALVS